MNKESSKSHVRSMRREISRYMILIIAITLAMVYGLTIFIMYREMSDLVRDQITQEADYIAGALNVSGQGYMRELDQALVSTRVTLISEDGDVLYDTDEEEFSFENHLDRPEIREALEKGRGTDLRRSSSIGEEMYYCAVLLEDGNVLRISKSAGTPWAIALRLLPAILLIGAAMVVAAALMTGYSVRSLIRPINLLDLNEPLKNDVYEELTPLLQRIDRQNREKEAVGEMRMEFSANVSHELKTPLTSISGYAEIMKNGLVKPADTVRFAEKIYREAGRMITLIDDIIRLSRLDEGIRSDPDQIIDMYDLAAEVLGNLEEKARSNGVELIQSGAHCRVRGERQTLYEVVYNLADNAIKYNHPGGSVSIETACSQGRSLIRVKDTGIGIPEDQKERIFERFYRVDKSHSRATGGTGLGLSIVKHGV
ncbi:MAG: two-component sensor histidine kinase, partial [Lachnospiraceae bacterium]|nr:two-component sensor histidine kinase [Lachnospiraceae bacterium]MBQ4303640.1 two-component sensor histidine kinase [Lachnospiraceae bacterium]